MFLFKVFFFEMFFSPFLHDFSIFQQIEISFSFFNLLKFLPPFPIC